MSKKLSLLSCFAAIFVACLMVASPALAHHKDGHEAGQTSTDETKGNPRKGGYEDNSSTPQETNHGKGADNDGDADSDPNTSYNEDNDTNDGGTPNNVSDEGDNAHPSGKDRSVEPGGSGNQGKSESNPDDSKGPMRYEGAQGDDKPNGPGGTDLADQDGNNGCGNDDDFNDDNNGWCGKRVKDTNKPTCPDGSTMPANGKCGEEPKLCPNGTQMPANGKCDEVLPGGITRNPPKPCDADDNMANGVQPCVDDKVLPELETNPSTPEDDVLGTRFSAAPDTDAVSPAVEPQGAVLPFTGGDVAIFLAAALGLIVAGLVTLKVRRSES